MELELFLSKIADTLIQNIDQFTDGTPEENRVFLQQHQKTVLLKDLDLNFGKKFIT